MRSYLMQTFLFPLMMGRYTYDSSYQFSNEHLNFPSFLQISSNDERVISIFLTEIQKSSQFTLGIIYFSIFNYFFIWMVVAIFRVMCTSPGRVDKVIKCFSHSNSARNETPKIKTKSKGLQNGIMETI